MSKMFCFFFDKTTKSENKKKTIIIREGSDYLLMFIVQEITIDLFRENIQKLVRTWKYEIQVQLTVLILEFCIFPQWNGWGNSLLKYKSSSPFLNLTRLK